MFLLLIRTTSNIYMCLDDIFYICHVNVQILSSKYVLENILSKNKNFSVVKDIKAWHTGPKVSQVKIYYNFTSSLFAFTIIHLLNMQFCIAYMLRNIWGKMLVNLNKTEPQTFNLSRKYTL